MKKKQIGFLLIVVLAVGIYAARRLAYRASQVPVRTNPATLPENGAGTPVPPEVIDEVMKKPEVVSMIAHLSKPEARRFRMLVEVCESKDVQDPRVARELTEMTPELKKAMMQYYRFLPREKTSSRSMAVSMIARGIEGKQDLDFLKSVLMESKPEGEVNAKTIEPQRAALNQIQMAYRELIGQKPANSALTNGLLDVLREATRAPIPEVAQQAKVLLNYLKR